MIEKSKIKKGMKVRISDNLDKEPDRAHAGLLGSMKKWQGKTVTITSIAEREKGFCNVKIKEDKGEYWWANDWIYPLVPEVKLDEGLFKL